MDENPYQSPRAVDEPPQHERPVPARVYWRDLIVWLAIGLVLVIFVLPFGSRQDEERRIAWIIVGTWLLFGAVLAWFARQKASR